MLCLSAELGHVWVACGWEGAADPLKTIMSMTAGASNSQLLVVVAREEAEGSSTRARAVSSSGKLVDTPSRRGSACPQLTLAARSSLLLVLSKSPCTLQDGGSLRSR